MKKDDVELSSGLSAFEAKHFSRAMQLLSPLAENGNTEAQHRCAIMYQNGLGNKANPLLAFKWMKSAAENGHALAQHGLGFMYMEGDCVEKNGEAAVHWYKKAASQGLVGSLTTLAMMYEEGNLVALISRKDIRNSHNYPKTSKNPKTKQLLENKGVKIHTYDGSEISIKGAGGPTCLTRPFMRISQ